MKQTGLDELAFIGDNFKNEASGEIAKLIYMKLDIGGISTEDLLDHIAQDSMKYRYLSSEKKSVYFMNALSILERLKLIKRKKDQNYYRTR